MEPPQYEPIATLGKLGDYWGASFFLDSLGGLGQGGYSRAFTHWRGPEVVHNTDAHSLFMLHLLGSSWIIAVLQACS